MVPLDIETAEFSTLVDPRLVAYDPVVFPNVARIPYAMPRCIDMQNKIFIKYLVSIDSNVSVGILPPKGVEDCSKVFKVTKKKTQTDKPQHVSEEVSK